VRIDVATLETLTANFSGELIRARDAGFDAAVRFCRDHDLPASVRGGGHAVAGHAICDGGVVTDLSAMTGSRVDPLARTIQLQGGCLNAHLDRGSQAFGLATERVRQAHTGQQWTRLTALKAKHDPTNSSG